MRRSRSQKRDPVYYLLYSFLYSTNCGTAAKSFLTKAKLTGTGKMITIHPGLKRRHQQPYTITIDSQIFFITHNEISGAVEYNCFVDDEVTRDKLKIILKNYLTNGKTVLY